MTAEAIAGIIVALGVPLGLWRWGRSWADRRAVYAWLTAHTKDEPSKTHASTLQIAKGVARSEERVRHACLTDKRIYHWKDRTSSEESWSVWCQEPKRNFQMMVVGPGVPRAFR